MNDTSDSSATSKTSSTEGACKYSYDSLRCKILDASLKLDGTVFDRFNIDLTGIEVGIRELSNEVFDCFRLGFGSSSPKKNVLFSPDQQCFRQSVSKIRRLGLKCLFNSDIFLHFTSF